MLGNIIIVLTSLLLFVNLVVVVICSIKPCIRKCYLSRLKKLAAARGKELRKQNRLQKQVSINSNDKIKNLSYEPAAAIE